MFFEYDVEEELLQKNREIEKLEQQVEQCQAEIRRLRCVCREYHMKNIWSFLDTGALKK